MDKEKLDAKGLSDLINKQSGVQGLSGISSDMREIAAAVAEARGRPGGGVRSHDGEQRHQEFNPRGQDPAD